MSVDWFFKLKEIDSLTKMKNTQLKNKSEQEERLAKLNERRQTNLTRIEELQHSTRELNHELAELEKKLHTASQQQQRLRDMGGDENKITGYQNEIDLAEEQGLEVISRLENIATEITEHKTFLSGLEKTLSEINQEVSTEVSKINSEVININLRIELLLNELPENFKNTFLKISAKNPPQGPFTRVDQGSCYFCRYKISRIDESEIDMQKNLKTCPQCLRIFLPYGA